MLSLQLALFCSSLLLFVQYTISATSDYLPLVGNTCNPNNTRLLLDNNQLRSDCGYVGWCDTSNNVCKVRGCRKDEWPFGFNLVERHLWPPLCPSTQFCPDEGSSCMNKVGLGQPCQLARDDECNQNASTGGVRCLHNTCVAVNATLGSTCIFENTIYTDFTDRNNNYGDIVSRDNCVVDTYCDVPTTQCKQVLAKGISCSADKECKSGYCFDKSFLSTVPVNNNFTGTCGDDPSAVKSKPYVYAIITIAIILISVGLGVYLVRIHLQQTKVKKAARDEYWQSQRLISGKAKIIDGSIRSNTPLLTAALNNSSLHPGNVRLSSQSTMTTTNPLRRESKLQHQQRYAEQANRRDSYQALNHSYSSTNINSRLQDATTTSHQNSTDGDYNAVVDLHDHMDDAFITPSQSTHSLIAGAFAENESGIASTSAVDPFSGERTARNRPSTGWQSPDVHLSPSR